VGRGGKGTEGIGRERRGREGREGNGSMHPLGFSKVGAYAQGHIFWGQWKGDKGLNNAI